MKVVKFSSELVPLVLSGEKTSTWRLFDDKDLKAGDIMQLMEFGADIPFAEAIINTVTETTFGNLNSEDKIGHESYSSDEEMYQTYSGYYKTTVGPDTTLKIIHFTIKE